MGKLVTWSRSEAAAAERASAVLARLTDHQQAEARAARALPALLVQRLVAGEGALVEEALRRWAGGDSALELTRWLRP
ncbi:MAG TPA: hypothetical protein VK191_15335 [Symbiobacteriaceae bacterium]|nr:hypothetical protein [Symbiobacteriaceae bacterium]